MRLRRSLTAKPWPELRYSLTPIQTRQNAQTFFQLWVENEK